MITTKKDIRLPELDMLVTLMWKGYEENKVYYYQLIDRLTQYQGIELSKYYQQEVLRYRETYLK